ncbi:hypothetical protein Glove_229g70 [Diversispora epigaea]|uniref:Uncharacterized protein n=1 Tax=Diversispora epigaea TaxID=1348612 RepID=A0A397IHM2_9GLOM|nr:hypothetical protein Glove_229g70 [Diversispora epigaea]
MKRRLECESIKALENVVVSVRKELKKEKAFNEEISEIENQDNNNNDDVDVDDDVMMAMMMVMMVMVMMMMFSPTNREHYFVRHIVQSNIAHDDFPYEISEYTVWDKSLWTNLLSNCAAADNKISTQINYLRHRK